MSVILSTGVGISGPMSFPGGGYVQGGWILPPPPRYMDLGYYRIWLVSGWYASYWNAFLFRICIRASLLIVSFLWFIDQLSIMDIHKYRETKMHSSRMHTSHSSPYKGVSVCGGLCPGWVLSGEWEWVPVQGALCQEDPLSLVNRMTDRQV